MLQQRSDLKVGVFRTMCSGAQISDILIDMNDGHFYEQRTNYDGTLAPPYVIGTYGDLQQIADDQRLGVDITYSGNLRGLHEGLVKMCSSEGFASHNMHEHICQTGPSIPEDQFQHHDCYP